MKSNIEFGQKNDRLDMGRDNALNNNSTGEQIYPLCVREHIDQINLKNCQIILHSICKSYGSSSMQEAMGSALRRKPIAV